MKTQYNDNGLGIAMIGIKPLGAKVYGLHFHEAPTDRGGISLSAKDKDTLLDGVKSLREEYGSMRDRVDKMGETLFQLQKTNLRNITSKGGYSPEESILGDPEKRALFNAAVRRAISAPLNEEHRKQIKALGEDTAPGSTFISNALLPEVYDTLATYGSWSTLAVRRMSTKTTKMPVQTARAVANWILAESDEIADDTTKAGTSVDLEVNIVAALINVSRQLVDDAEIDVTEDVLNDFVEAINERLDFTAFQGAGTENGTHGGYTGIFTGGTAVAAAAGNTTTEDLELEDFVRCLTTVDPVVLTRKARWWIHPTILARICTIRDGNGRPIFQTALEAPAPGAIGSILGYPVVLTMGAPSANVAGSKVACFGDPNGCVVGVRTDFSFEASDHHKWNNFQRSFRAIARAGVKIRRATAFGVLTTAAV